MINRACIVLVLRTSLNYVRNIKAILFFQWLIYHLIRKCTIFLVLSLEYVKKFLNIFCTIYCFDYYLKWEYVRYSLIIKYWKYSRVTELVIFVVVLDLLFWNVTLSTLSLFKSLISYFRVRKKLCMLLSSTLTSSNGFYAAVI